MIAFFYFLAYLNNFQTCFSDSPTYFDIISEALIVKKTASDSVAQAFAKNVFPVPGGPYNKIPFHGFLIPIKMDGNFIGTITASLSCSFAVSSPAMSIHQTLGFSYRIISSPASLSSSSESFSF